jgi:hypothetical protein
MPLRSDPGRLPRRNHYQDGPAFLSLATQGGRPLEADVAADVASVVRLRAAALRRWHAGEPATQVAAELGIGRATLYRWQERYGEQGLTGLVDAPRPGRASELDPILERVIITVCLLTNWNSRRYGSPRGLRTGALRSALLGRWAAHRASGGRSALAQQGGIAERLLGSGRL